MIIGPAGTGKSHTLIGLGIAAVHAGPKVRYFIAVDLVETLYRGLADNTVGKIIDTRLRQDLIIIDEMGFAPLDDTGTQLLFRLVVGAYERRSLAVDTVAVGNDRHIATQGEPVDGTSRLVAAVAIPRGGEPGAVGSPPRQRKSRRDPLELNFIGTD